MNEKNKKESVASAEDTVQLGQEDKSQVTETKSVSTEEVKIQLGQEETVAETKVDPVKEVKKTETKVEPVEEMTSTEIKEQKKAFSKNLIVIGVNFLLAGISIYAFEFWFRHLFTDQSLSALQIAENIGIVLLTALTYFVGKTFYTKGVINNIKKILITFALAASVLGLMLLSVYGETGIDQSSVVYPLSGIVVVSIAFYMLSLTAGTLNIIGIVALTMFFGAFIAFAKLFGWIDWEWVGTLSKVAIFVILFFGGTWAQIRLFLHGVRGVNKDGGGFGSSDNNGDAGDGDGDTGDED